MKRIGVIDFDTSHVFQFVSRLNHVGIAEDQWVEGATVVVGCPGKSEIYPQRIPEETEKIKKLGLELVSSPEDMLKYDLDAVFIESNSGLQHLERAEFFLKHKLPLFVDKPFTCSSRDAERIFELADQAGVPVFSSSSLRYAPEVVAFKASNTANSPTLGCMTWGPASLDPKNPGLYHYGIHAVEMLFTIMGAGCESLSCTTTPQVDLVTGTWSGGRVASVRGIRPSSDYGFVSFVDGASKLQHVGTGNIYRELLKAIVGMLQTGKSPVPPQETLEIVRFIELAAESAANHGALRHLKGA
ncbi:MAG: Gfo/Idh/MocA family oxidoreductase [Planctomycetota bacterium]